MNFSPAQIIRDAVAPSSILSVNALMWWGVLHELRRRGEGRRESGAFFLGSNEGQRRLIRGVLYYDDLDPHALDTGAILLDGAVYARVFRECERRGMRVVADVHTHPGRSAQSCIDQEHPMIREAGHLALILPRYAVKNGGAIGLYEYRGGRAWTAHPEKLFYRGLCG